MNWIDLSIIGIILVITFEGIRRSFINEILDFCSFLLAFFLSLKYYFYIAQFYQQNFQIPPTIGSVLGFVTIWFLVETLFVILIHTLVKKSPLLMKINHILNPYSFIPAFFRALIFVTIIILLIAVFPVNPVLKKAVEDSRISSYVLSRTPYLETSFKSIFGGISDSTLTFFTIKPKSDESVDLGFKISQFKERLDLESRMIDLVNKERESRGLNRLKFDSKLRQVGIDHSKDMFERGYFSHYSPEGETVADRAKKRNVQYFIIGENLAYAPSLELAHNGLMNSEGHRANILSTDYNKVGIGILDGGAYGLMITQVFSD